MIRDLMQQAAATEHRSQFCIVGAGAAGISLAVMLSRAGRQVTLLEGGGATNGGGNDSFHATASGLKYRGILEGRAQGLGGTTALWGGQILPLSDLDFEHRPWIAGSGWPIRKTELQPFYNKALTLEGLSSTITSDDAVWAKIGEPPPVYTHVRTYLSRWCPEPNFARLHGKALQHENLSVWLNARTVRLQLSGETVRSVTARTPAGVEHTFHADEFIFCLGAIESSRFFLQPQEGTLPWNTSGLLGRHFQDHVDCDAATIVPRDAAALSRTFDAIYVEHLKYLPKLRLTEAEQERQFSLNVGATVYTPQHADATYRLRRTARSLLRAKVPDQGLTNGLRDLSQTPAMVQQGFRYLLRHRGSLQTSKPLTLRVHCEQEPCGNSTIRLARDRDQFGMQRAVVHWSISEKELDTIRGFTRTITRALAPVAEVQPHPDLFRRSADFRSSCQDSFHHMGGMRMDVSASGGVVDANLQLHGTKNCFVCSSAVFPSSGYSNPTHTLLALAVRLAEHLTK